MKLSHSPARSASAADQGSSSSPGDAQIPCLPDRVRTKTIAPSVNMLCIPPAAAAFVVVEISSGRRDAEGYRASARWIGSTAAPARRNVVAAAPRHRGDELLRAPVVERDPQFMLAMEPARASVRRARARSRARQWIFGEVRESQRLGRAAPAA